MTQTKSKAENPVKRWIPGPQRWILRAERSTAPAHPLSGGFPPLANTDAPLGVQPLVICFTFWLA